MLHDVLRDAARFAAILRGFALRNNAQPARASFAGSTLTATSIAIAKKISLYES
jgi:hypothetical protein